MQKFLWLIVEKLVILFLTSGKSPRLGPINEIDDRFVLPVLLKELDHIQAIIGRYDTFFFLLKQLCLASIFAIIGAYLSKPFDGLGLLVFVPIIFYAFDYAFRCAFWSGFIVRVIEVESFLNGCLKTTRLYSLNERVPFAKRARLAMKLFDAVFYLGLVIAILMLSHAAGGKPWYFKVHAS